MTVSVEMRLLIHSCLVVDQTIDIKNAYDETRNLKFNSVSQYATTVSTSVTL